jgi:phospholipid/cholesterol/gamma-HCH transport system permease protein
MPEMIRHWQDEQGTLRVAAAGRWTFDEARALDQQLRDMDDHLEAGITSARFDLGEVSELDTCGAALLLTTHERLAAAGADVRFIGIQERHLVLLNHLQEWRKKAASDSVPPASMMERLTTPLIGIGARIASLGAEARDLVAFIGLTLARSSSMYRRRHRLRLGAVLFQLQQIWLKALPLGALAPFLIALATTYVGAAQLGQLGAGNIAVQAIALAILWEIGVLLPAILVAGRSASAFAGEIGAMKAGEEIDSMFVVGLDPMVTLIIPRVVALLIALPLLGIVGQISGLVGCFLMASAHLGLSPSEYIERVESAAGINIFLVGLLKTPFFGLIIAFVGCFQGMKVSGAAIEVGERATRAVVQALFLVILFDALYSVAFWMTLQGP